MAVDEFAGNSELLSCMEFTDRQKKDGHRKLIYLAFTANTGG